MNTYKAFTQERDQQIINEQKHKNARNMSGFQRFGASVMSLAGRVSDTLTGNDETNDHLSPLRRHAYGNTIAAVKARKIWATIGLSAMTLTGSSIGVAAYQLGDYVADRLACEGEVSAYLETGQTISDLAKTVPRENMSVKDVADEIIRYNGDMIGDSSVTHENDDTQARIGLYTTPQNCFSSI